MVEGNNIDKSCGESKARNPVLSESSRFSAVDKEDEDTNQLNDLISKLTFLDEVVESTEIDSVVKEFENITLNKKALEENVADSDDENYTEDSDKEYRADSEVASKNDLSESDDENDASGNNEIIEPTNKKEINENEEETAEREEEEKYLTRGLLPQNKTGHRFSPMQPSAGSNSYHSHNRNTGKSINNSFAQETSVSNVFDVINFSDIPKEESSAFQVWPNQQSISGRGSQNFLNNLCQPSYSFYNNNDSNLFENINNLEAHNDDWSKKQPEFYLDNAYDFSNNLMYQPPTPPKSVSPMLKENLEENQLNSSHDNYNVKKSEDLINIINAINLANKTEPSGIPEAELEKLRSVLEGNDDRIRSEMDMYLTKDESIFQNDILSSGSNIQTTTNILEDDDCSYWFDGEPLTPPSSIPPPPQQDGSSSPSWEQDEISQLCSEEHLSDILNGIDEINPDELNIYLEKDKQSIYDTSYAKTWLQNKCKPNALDHAFRRLSQTSSKVMCKKDKDGDTGLMIVYSQIENSPDFYENVFCMQEIVQEIKVCCEIPLGKAKRCKTCGNTDSSKFYTPLSFKNNQGYSALCCAVTTNFSQVIVDFLLDGILRNEEDVRRVFDDTGKDILAEFSHVYPSLKRFI